MNGKFPDGFVLAVCKNPDPGIPKVQSDSIQLLEDFGVEGDYHAGKKVRHRYLVKKDPNLPNQRQSPAAGKTSRAINPRVKKSSINIHQIGKS